MTTLVLYLVNIVFFSMEIDLASNTQLNIYCRVPYNTYYSVLNVIYGIATCIPKNIKFQVAFPSGPKKVIKIKWKDLF